MYSVSERFKEEIKKPQRITRIIGRIRTAAGADYTITDENVITGSLKITDRLGSGEFSIGGVYSRNMTVRLLGFSNITDVSNLSNARVILRFRLVYSIDKDGSEDYEDVPLGVFSVDGSKTKRKFDIVTLTATDNMQNFDRDAKPNENITLYNAAAMACERCGVGLATSSEEFAGFPNSDVTVTYTTDQIQTWRDLLMWIGELTGTFARINLGGALEFVQMKAEIGSDNRIIPAAEIPPDVRFTTDFSDTTIRVPKVIMRRNNAELSQSSSWDVSATSAMVATMELNDNPLIADKTDEEVSGYLKKLANYLVKLLHRPFETSFNGNPALQVGDYVRLRGGAIDISQAYATGIITYSCWRYRGKHDIKCRSYTTTVRQSDSNAIALMSADDNIAALDGAPPEIMRKPKSQLEKEMDALRAKAGSGGVGKAAESDPTSEYFNDYENNITVGGYSHTEGTKNRNEYGTGTHVEGSENTAQYLLFSHVEGQKNTAQYCGSVHVEGRGNTVTNAGGASVSGTENTLDRSNNGVRVDGYKVNVTNAEQSYINGGYLNCEDIYGSIIVALNTSNVVYKLKGIRRSAVFGTDDEVSGAFERSLLAGDANSIDYTYDSAVLGNSNKISGTSNNVYVFGKSNKLTNAGSVLAFGMGLELESAAKYRTVLGQYNVDRRYTDNMVGVLLLIGNGSGQDRRSNGFLVDENGNVYCNRVIETGSKNIEDYFSGTSAQTAKLVRTLTAAAAGGIPIKLLDHAPTAEDLTGSECIFLQCESTAEVEGETTGIFKVTDVFAERALQ